MKVPNFSFLMLYAIYQQKLFELASVKIYCFGKRFGNGWFYIASFGLVYLVIPLLFLKNVNSTV